MTTEPIPSQETIPQWKLERLEHLQNAIEAKRSNKLLAYVPYPKQAEFHELGGAKRERLLMAGNRLGKSEAGAAEFAIHLTGLYPAWWKGRRFKRAITAWCGGESSQAVRDVAQTKLCGTPGVTSAWGTGLIPKNLLLDKSASHGASDAIDTLQVRHASGGVSVAQFKSYEQGRQKWQGSDVDVVWMDEEPPVDVYIEGLTRTNAKKDGIVFMTFTPLLGMAGVVNRFLNEPSPDRAVVTMGIKDALHIDEDRRASMIASYPAHEREARVNGVPLLGSGRVWEDVIEADITEPAWQLSAVPSHWPSIWGLDFGGHGSTHPFAAALLAWDRDTDCVHVLQTIRMLGGTAANHASAIKNIAGETVCSWPHDGWAKESDGRALAEQYKREGLHMLPSHATHVSGGFATEPGVVQMLSRMRSSRFKVGAHLTDWWGEFRQYHRKDGLIVKLNDDLMSATRIGAMSLRFARTVPLIASAGAGFRPRGGVNQSQCLNVDFEI